MAEQLNLSAPVVHPTLSSYKVERTTLDRGQVEALAEIVIQLRGVNGEVFVHRYFGATARTLITQLNVANLTTTSLEKRILQRLTADGVLSGTITGTPE
jgi:hypothetical protein